MTGGRCRRRSTLALDRWAWRRNDRGRATSSPLAAFAGRESGRRGARGSGRTCQRVRRGDVFHEQAIGGSPPTRGTAWLHERSRCIAGAVLAAGKECGGSARSGRRRRRPLLDGGSAKAQDSGNG